MSIGPGVKQIWGEEVAKAIAFGAQSDGGAGTNLLLRVCLGRSQAARDRNGSAPAAPGRRKRRQKTSARLNRSAQPNRAGQSVSQAGRARAGGRKTCAGVGLNNPPVQAAKSRKSFSF